MPNNPRAGRPYMRALAALKARGEVQECWRQASPDCARILHASAPKGHPQSITLGHLIAIEDGAAECMKCNYGDGARRTNAKKNGTATDFSSYRNPNW